MIRTWSLPTKTKPKWSGERRLLHKVEVGQNVYELALDRIRKCYELFDHVAVSFSGGKDSTVVMELTVQVARELGRLPVRVVFWDEECIAQQTADFVARTGDRTDVALEWLVLPTAYHNSCSIEEPTWYPWGPEYEDLWVRPMPDHPTVIKDLPGWKWYPKEERGFHINSNGFVFDPEKHGQAVLMMGIRSAESLMRTRALLGRFNESWLHEHDINVKGTLLKAYPIYDWRTDDVWKAIGDFGWDYNAAYDAMAMVGIAPHNQRISSPFHVEALVGLTTWAAAYPETYDRMINRVPGAATAARYAKGELFGRGRTTVPKPDGLTWREWVVDLIRRKPDDRQRYLAHRIASDIRNHFSKTDEPILPKTPHPLTGYSWGYLTKLAEHDDWLNRHQPPRNPAEAEKRRVLYDAELRAIKAAGKYEEIRP